MATGDPTNQDDLDDLLNLDVGSIPESPPPFPEEGGRLRSATDDFSEATAPGKDGDQKKSSLRFVEEGTGPDLDMTPVEEALDILRIIRAQLDDLPARMAEEFGVNN